MNEHNNTELQWRMIGTVEVVDNFCYTFKKEIRLQHSINSMHSMILARSCREMTVTCYASLGSVIACGLISCAFPPSHREILLRGPAFTLNISNTYIHTYIHASPCLLQNKGINRRLRSSVIFLSL